MKVSIVDGRRKFKIYWKGSSKCQVLILLLRNSALTILSTKLLEGYDMKTIILLGFLNYS